MLETKTARGVSPSTRLKLLWLAAGVFLAALLSTGVDAAEYVFVEHPRVPTAAVARALPLEPLQVDPSWILDGKPTFRIRSFAHSLDGLTDAGIWECEGPTKFRWQFAVDETVYILDGLVNVDYGGAVHTLRPGSVAFFPAGVTAIWHVPENVKKSFTLSEPGRLRRLMRKLFFP